MTTLVLTQTQNGDGASQAPNGTGNVTPDQGTFTYTSGDTPPGTLNGFRFENVTIPAGSTISAASVSLYGSTSKYVTLDSVIDGIAQANVGLFASTLTSYGTIGHTVTWNATLSTTAYTASPDISAIVGAIIAQAGWASGNAAAVILTATSGANAHYVNYAAGGNIPELSITYTGGSTPLNGTASPSATASMGASGTVALGGAGAPSATGTVGATGGITLHGTASPSGSAALGASGTVTLHGTGAPTGTAAVGTAGRVVLSGSATPVAAAGLRAVGTIRSNTVRGEVAVADTARFTAVAADTSRYTAAVADTARWGITIGDSL